MRTTASSPWTIQRPSPKASTIPVVILPFLRFVSLASLTIIQDRAAASSNDVIEYRVLEEQPENSLIGNVAVDARLHAIYPAQTLVNLRFNLLSAAVVSGSVYSDQFNVGQSFVLDQVSGLLRTSKTLDREELCRRPSSTTCFVQLDVTITPVSVEANGCVATLVLSSA